MWAGDAIVRILKPIAVSVVALVTIGSGTVQILGFFGIKEAKDLKMPVPSVPHWSGLIFGLLLFLFGVCLVGYYLWQSLVENKQIRAEAERNLRAKLDAKDKQHKEEIDRAQQQHNSNEAGLSKLAERRRREATHAQEIVELLQQEITAKDSELRNKDSNLSSLVKEIAEKEIQRLDSKCPHLLSYERFESHPGYFAFPNGMLTMQTVVIRNTDFDLPVTANNVSAKIEYRHKHGLDVFVVPEATWIAPNVLPQFSGPQSRILIAPGEVARLAVVAGDNATEKKWVITRLEPYGVKQLAAGRWDLKIIITRRQL